MIKVLVKSRTLDYFSDFSRIFMTSGNIKANSTLQNIFICYMPDNGPKTLDQIKQIQILNLMAPVPTISTRSKIVLHSLFCARRFLTIRSNALRVFRSTRNFREVSFADTSSTNKTTRKITKKYFNSWQSSKIRLFPIRQVYSVL